MITIAKVYTPMADGEQGCSPERQLTSEEKATVVAIWGDEENLFYFQIGDEQHPKYIEYLALTSNTNG